MGSSMQRPFYRARKSNGSKLDSISKTKDHSVHYTSFEASVKNSGRVDSIVSSSAYGPTEMQSSVQKGADDLLRIEGSNLVD